MVISLQKPNPLSSFRHKYSSIPLSPSGGIGGSPGDSGSSAIRNVWILFYIFSWYFFSTCLNIFNKTLVGKNNVSFPYPMFACSIQAVVHFLISTIILKITGKLHLHRFPSWRSPPIRSVVSISPSSNPLFSLSPSSAKSLSSPSLLSSLSSPSSFPPLLSSSSSSLSQSSDSLPSNNGSPLSQVLQTRQHPNQPTTLTLNKFMFSVVPAALCTALDIALSNASVAFITLSFYTMVKSSVPVFVVIFSFAFRLEPFNFNLLTIISVIVFGVCLTVMGEAQFHLTGFLMVLTASVCSGLRWALTQILLTKASLGMDNPVSTLFYLSPVMAISQFVLFFIYEYPVTPSFTSTPFFATFIDSFQTICFVSLGSVLAYSMMTAEFFLVKATSVISLSVIGMAKEVITILLAMVIFGDRLGAVNSTGLIVTLAGIAAYNAYRIKRNLGNHGGKEMIEKEKIEV